MTSLEPTALPSERPAFDPRLAGRVIVIFCSVAMALAALGAAGDFAGVGPSLEMAAR